MPFHPALGDVETIPARLRSLFDSERFPEKRPPEPADWLAVRDESGQPFDRYVGSDPVRPNADHSTVYLQPLGSFEGTQSPSLEALKSVAEAFFQTPVRAREPLALSDNGLTRRHHRHDDHLQLLTTDILALLADNLPDDAVCQVGITMIDLYPQPDWNFVFGQASLRNRVGLYSFARYRADDPVLTMERSVKVMAHEIAHMFGIRHCPYFECLMNGTNNLPEADRRPAFLCPVDLRKLWWCLEFDPAERYRDLAEVYRHVGLEAYARRASDLARGAN